MGRVGGKGGKEKEEKKRRRDENLKHETPNAKQLF